MKKVAKKSLAILLALVLATSAAVSVLAYDTSSADVTGFYASIDSYAIKPKLRWLNFVLNNRFTAVNADAFSFMLKDSNGKTIANETTGHIETFTPAENEGFGFEVYFYFNAKSLPTLNSKETYTLTVPAGIFSTDGGEQSAAFTVSFAAADFIEKRTGFFGFLDTIYNTPFLRVLFAPFIALVELIYLISVTIAMK